MAFGTKKWNLCARWLFHGFATDNRISCRPIMQNLFCLMTQAKTYWICNSKRMEVTGGLYWLLVRRIGTHWLVGCWMALKPTVAFLVNRSCRAFLASEHKLKHIGYIIATMWKRREGSIGCWYVELVLISLFALGWL